MAEKKTFAFRKKILYSFFALFLLLLLIEALLSVIYFQQYGGERFAILSVVRKIRQVNQNRTPVIIDTVFESVIRPGVSLDEVQKIHAENDTAGFYDYAPWVMHKTRNFSGKYFHVYNFLRSSLPSKYIVQPGSKPIRIFFLGGSTMFGIGVTDTETIPAQLINICKEKNITVNIEVFNYGIPAYYSYQELMLLTQLLFNKQEIDIVIFMDGLNDFKGLNASRQRIPFLNFRYSKTFEEMNTVFSNPRLIDSSNKYTMTVDPDSLQSYSLSSTLNYLSVIGSVQQLSKVFGFKPFFFVQPVPYYNYPEKKSDTRCDKAPTPQFDLIYPLLKKESQLGKYDGLCYIGDLLETKPDNPFIDAIHYTPSMNKRIAAAILEKIQPALPQTK